MISMATKGIICYREIVSPPVSQTIGDTDAVLDLSAISAAMYGEGVSQTSEGGVDSMSSDGSSSTIDSEELESKGGC